MLLINFQEQQNQAVSNLITVMMQEEDNNDQGTRSKGIFSDNHVSFGGGTDSPYRRPPAGYPNQHAPSFPVHGYGYGYPPQPPPTAYPIYGYAQPGYQSPPPPPIPAPGYGYPYGTYDNCKLINLIVICQLNFFNLLVILFF